MAIDTSFSDIDLNAKISKPTLLLCRPSDQKSIANMSPHAFNVKMKVSLGNISELSFSLPYDIEINHKLARLPYIDSVRDRYYIKVIYNQRTEIFIITDIDNNMDDSGDIKHIKAYSLAYSLHDKLINSYEVTSYTLEEVVNDVLGMTTWTHYWIDPLFNQRYRSFSITSEMSVLDFLVEVAETFGAILYFDTVNKQISFYKPESLEFDKGLFIKPGRYLQSLNQNISTQDVCTHLRIVGKDGLTINRLTPTGSGELVDYTTFLYPYEEDELGNVVSHSHYFSDSLAKSIIEYNNLLESKEGIFSSLLTQLDTLQSQLIVFNSELETLQAELKILSDTRDVGSATDQDISGILIEIQNKEDDIVAKQTEINNKQGEIDAVYDQIILLKDEVSEINNFTQDELREKNELSIVRYYYNQYCDDDKELYQLGIEYFDKIKSPQLVQSLGITNFLSVVDCQRDWDKIGLGYIIRLHVEKFGIDVKLKITDIEYDFDNTDSINITISNVVNYLSDKEKFIKELYKKSISTSTTVELNKGKFNTINDVTSDFYQYITSELDTATQEINAGVSNSVNIGRRGVIVTDPSNPMKKIHMTAGVIGLSLDGGNTFQTAIKPDGIISQRLIGQIILGEQLTISNANGDFIFNKDGLSISQSNINIDGGLSDDQIASAESWNSSISQNAQNIELKVSKDDVINSINLSNEGVRVDATKVTIGTGTQFEEGYDTTDLTSSLGDVAYLDKIEKAMLGETVIIGGYLNTEVLASDSILSDHIAANAITADHIAANAITADHIAANSITAEKLLIGNWDNLIEDPHFETGLDNFLVVFPTAVDVSRNYYRSFVGGNSIQIKNVENAYLYTKKYYKVAPGEKYLLSMHVHPGGSNNNRTGRWVMRASYNDGTNSWHTNNYSVHGTFEWKKYTYIYTVPEGVHTVRFGFGARDLNDSSIFFDNFVVRKMTTGELVVDGSITADKLTATAIDGKTITGSIVRTAASGTRAEMGGGSTPYFDTYLGNIKRMRLESDRLNFYDENGMLGGYMKSVEYSGGSVLSLFGGQIDQINFHGMIGALGNKDMGSPHSIFALNDIQSFQGKLIGNSVHALIDTSQFSNVSISGSLSKGSGTFLIDHPLDPDNKDLVHGFVESPKYELIYRGKVRLVGGVAEVDIDAMCDMSEGTFVALTQNAEVTSLCNLTGFARVKPTKIVDGKFTITSETKSTDEISWVVIAERADYFIVNGDRWTDEKGRLIPEHNKPQPTKTDDKSTITIGTRRHKNLEIKEVCEL